MKYEGRRNGHRACRRRYKACQVARRKNIHIVRFVRRMELDVNLDISENRSLLYWSISKRIRCAVDLDENIATLPKQLESKMVKEKEGLASNAIAVL